MWCMLWGMSTDILPSHRAVEAVDALHINLIWALPCTLTINVPHSAPGAHTPDLWDLGEIIRFSLNAIFGLFCDGALEPGIVAALFLINSTETIDNTAPAGWWGYLVHYLRWSGVSMLHAAEFCPSRCRMYRHTTHRSLGQLCKSYARFNKTL